MTHNHSFCFNIAQRVLYAVLISTQRLFHIDCDTNVQDRRGILVGKAIQMCHLNAKSTKVKSYNK